MAPNFVSASCSPTQTVQANVRSGMLILLPNPDQVPADLTPTLFVPYVKTRLVKNADGTIASKSPANNNLDRLVVRGLIVIDAEVSIAFNHSDVFFIFDVVVIIVIIVGAHEVSRRFALIVAIIIV